MAPFGFDGRDRNPYTRLLYGHLAELGVEVIPYSKRTLVSGHVDVWHIQWPENLVDRESTIGALVACARFLSLVRAARLRNVRIAWTVHNLHGHSRRRPGLEQWLMRRFTKMVDVLISMSDTAHALIVERYPELRRAAGFVIPHGHYRGAYPNIVSRVEARQYLGIAEGAIVLLHLGGIRPYKNVPKLVEAFRSTANRDAMLVIAGSPSTSRIRDELERAAGGDTRVVLRLQYVKDDEIQHYFNAADVAVLPFTDILNSGSAMLALSFDVPVVAPRQGSLIDLHRVVGGRWLWLYDEQLSSTVLETALASAKLPYSRCSALDIFDWPNIARMTLRAYESRTDGARATMSADTTRARPVHGWHSA